MPVTENQPWNREEKSVDNPMRNNAFLDTIAETQVELWAAVTVSAKEAHVTETGREELLPGWNWWHDSIQTSARTALSKEAW